MKPPFFLFLSGALLFSAAAAGDASAALSQEALETLIRRCAPGVSPDTMKAVVLTESSANPFAVGVAGGLFPQPQTEAEALAAVSRLRAERTPFALGLAQISSRNFSRLGLTDRTALDACTNLQAGAKVLSECFAGTPSGATARLRLRMAFSCYSSGRAAPDSAYARRVEKNAGISDSDPSIRSPP